jgi:hypothetical protein
VKSPAQRQCACRLRSVPGQTTLRSHPLTTRASPVRRSIRSGPATRPA